MVTRIDRLARSIGDLEAIVRVDEARGASLKVTERHVLLASGFRSILE
jgi:DNA invertase Pin-like site-specific DNA recombinase